MGLRETLLAGVTTAINALDNIPKDISYRAVAVGAYDVDQDRPTTTETIIACKGIVYKSKEENQDYKKTTLMQTKVLIAGEVFIDESVEPDEQDYMVIDGDRYEIKLIAPAPQNACYVFTVRKV